MDQSSAEQGKGYPLSQQHFFNLEQIWDRAPTVMQNFWFWNFSWDVMLSPMFINLQIFGDALIIINWMCGSSKMGILSPNLVFEQIKRMNSVLVNLTYKHIYREWNTTAGLSKEALEINPGTSKIIKMNGMFPSTSQSSIFCLIHFYIAGTSTKCIKGLHVIYFLSLLWNKPSCHLDFVDDHKGKLS